MENEKDHELDDLIDAKTFGERLKLMRVRRGWDVASLANKIGVHRSTFAGYETQEKFPPIEKLSKIAYLLHTSTDFLIGLTDDPSPAKSSRELKEYIQETKNLHWDGIPLTEEQLKPLAELFEYVVKKFVDQPSDDEKNAK